MTQRIPVQMLGQSGCRLAFPGATVYLDPYLSNSVQELDAPDITRLKPIAYPPARVTDADWVLITHDHIDHCDPHTIPQLASASSRCRFVGPPSVRSNLIQWGVEGSRIVAAVEDWQTLAPGLRICAVPAAHPAVKRDAQGQLACVGYLLDYAGQRIYLAGDTSVTDEILETLKAYGPIHTAFLPVNEHNYFRGRRGIIGNMSVREAFQLAVEIGASQVVAVHWDMFEINSVDPEEIRIVHQRMRPGFRLLIDPETIEL
jgi:L-ascorbate metabolism protein UlaG (beta-lactamase superfamily)